MALKYIIIPILLFLVLLGLLSLFTNHTQAEISPNLQDSAQKAEFPVIEDPIALIRQYSQEYGLDGARMLELARCESSLRQFDQKGDVLPGKMHSSDKGIFQINIDPKETEWDEDSKLTGYDWRTLDGNIQLAMVIASSAGYGQWVCNDILNNHY